MEYRATQQPRNEHNEVSSLWDIPFLFVCFLLPSLTLLGDYLFVGWMNAADLPQLVTGWLEDNWFCMILLQFAVMVLVPSAILIRPGSSLRSRIAARWALSGCAFHTALSLVGLFLVLLLLTQVKGCC